MDEKPNPASYGELVDRFRETLADMEVWLQFGGTRNYDPVTSAGEKAWPGPPRRFDEVPWEYWREQWELHEPIVPSEQRNAYGKQREVWEGAWEWLDGALKQKEIVVQGESKIELEARIVAEGEGWSVRDVALHHRVTETFVRRARENAAKAIAKESGPDRMNPRIRARELAEKGLSTKAITAFTGVSTTEVRRIKAGL